MYSQVLLGGGKYPTSNSRFSRKDISIFVSLYYLRISEKDETCRLHYEDTETSD